MVSGRGLESWRYLADVALLILTTNDDAVKRVVADGLARRFLHPCIESSAQGLALVLDGEVDERGGSAERSGACAGFKIIGAGGAAERHVEMRVYINAAGQNVLPFGVDYLLHVLARKTLADGFDFAATDGDVAGVSVGRGDHAAVNDERIDDTDIEFLHANTAVPAPTGDRMPSLAEAERAHIVRVLEAVQWNKKEASRVLDISRGTLYRKIDEYQLEPEPRPAGRRGRETEAPT